MSNPVHDKSDIKLTIKKGEVHYTQKEKYKLPSGDESIDKFKGDCPLDSQNLKQWLNSVVESWIDGDSIRPDAVAPGDN